MSSPATTGPTLAKSSSAVLCVRRDSWGVTTSPSTPGVTPSSTPAWSSDRKRLLPAPCEVLPRAARQRWSPEGQSSQETDGHVETLPSRGSLATGGHCSLVSSLILSLYCFQKAHGSLRSKSTFGPLAEATWNRLLTVEGEGKSFWYFFPFVLGGGGREGARPRLGVGFWRFTLVYICLTGWVDPWPPTVTLGPWCLLTLRIVFFSLM